MQTQQAQQPEVLPLPVTIGQELKNGGPKRSTKAKGTKGTVTPVKSGLNLKLVMGGVVAALESKRTTAIHAYLDAAQAIKEPTNIEDARKVLLESLTAKHFPSAAARASEFASVAYAWHHDAPGVEVAIYTEAIKMKDGKEVIGPDGNPVTEKPSETVIMKRIRAIRQTIEEGEPGYTKKGNRNARTASKLNATQFARMLDYLKLMDGPQFEKFSAAYDAECKARQPKEAPPAKL